MNEQETAVFVSEIRKDIQYIKEILEAKFKVYDKQCDERYACYIETRKDFKSFREDELIQLNKKIERVDTMHNIIWGVLGIIIAAFVGGFFYMLRTP